MGNLAQAPDFWRNELNIDAMRIPNEKTKNNLINPINKKCEVYPFVLEFMELPVDTLVSKAEIFSSFTNFVKIELNSNPLMFREDRREFNLIGKLDILFQKIFEIKKMRENLPNDYIFPDFLRYIDFMQYIKYCML